MKLPPHQQSALFWKLLFLRLVVALIWLKVAGCSSTGSTATGTGGAVAGDTGTGGGATGGDKGTGSGGSATSTGGVALSGLGGAAGGPGRGGLSGSAGAGGAAEPVGSGGAAGADAGHGGASGSAGGASAAQGVCPGDKAPNPDVATSCTPTNAKTGAACTQNCCVGCGIDLLGIATCACTNHKYVNCTCPLPAAWTALGGECGDSSCLTAGGPCSPQGYASKTDAPAGASVLEGQPCVMNGNVCFTAESDGKHGCVCASDPSGDFVMRCGLVEGWFSNNGLTTSY